MLLRKSCLLFALAMSGMGSAPGVAAEPLTVSLDSGQTLRGELDERTNDQTLWVRREQDGIRLTTAVPWARVVEAGQGDGVIHVAELRAKREAYMTPAEQFFAGEWRFAEEQFAEQSDYQRMAAPRLKPETVLARGSTRVASVQILDVFPANFDRDGSIDGLVVQIAALDEQGRTVAARGSLRSQLWTERRPWRVPGGGKFAAEENWSQAFSKSDFVDGVATVKLPFRSLEPEAEFDLLPDAELVVQLTAYGSGNFEANAPVCLRPYDRFRDRLQQNEGTRYVPNELPGRMGRQRFDDTNGRWMGWP